MMNNKKTLLLALGTVTMVFGCKHNSRNLNTEDSSISAFVGSISTQPEGLEKALDFKLICGEISYNGKLQDQNVKFVGTNAVSVGESCRVEAWGKVLADQYEYFGKKEGDQAQYIVTVKNKVPANRKLSLFSSLVYRKISATTESNVSMFIGPFDGEFNKFAAVIKCGVGSSNKEIVSQVVDGNIEFKVAETEFVNSDKIVCKNLSLTNGEEGKIYVNSDTEIELTKTGISKENMKEMKVKLKETISAGDLDVSLDEKFLDGIYLTDCIKPDPQSGIEISTAHRIFIDTNDSSVRSMMHSEITFDNAECQGNGVEVDKIYEMMTTGSGALDGSLTFRLVKDGSAEVLYSMLRITEGKLELAKGEGFSYFTSKSEAAVPNDFNGGMVLNKQ